MMDIEESIKKSERSEEVFDIIEKMPISFGKWVTLVVIFIVVVLFSLGWIIHYPDTVSGEISIVSRSAPINLVANTSGRLILNTVKPRDEVKAGDYLAVIQNPANTTDVKEVIGLLKGFNHNIRDLAGKAKYFPKNVSLGELNVKYFTFIDALEQISNYQNENLFQKQEDGLEKQIAEQTALLQQNNSQEEIKKKSLVIEGNFYKTDSILFSHRATSKSEFEKTKLEYLSSKEGYQNSIMNIISNQQELEDAKNKLQQLYIQKDEKENQMKIDLLSAYGDLLDNIKSWEQKYVFKAPIDGKVEFMQFWNNNQFIEAGEKIFTIVPKENMVMGQMLLPENGSGNVKVGQTVIIKLDNYPYLEYGTINGKVGSISLTTNQENIANNGMIEIYLVQVNLPDQLKTNYGANLEFKYEMKGEAEIITKDRRLTERLFDNLKYVLKK